MVVAIDVSDSKYIVPSDCVEISDAMDEAGGTNMFEVGETTEDMSDLIEVIEGGVVEVGKISEDKSDVFEDIEDSIFEVRETSEDTSIVVVGTVDGMSVVLLEERAISGTRVLADKVSTSGDEVTPENASGPAVVSELGGDEMAADDDDNKSNDGDCDPKDEDMSVADKGARTREVSDKLCGTAVPELFCCVDACRSLSKFNEESGVAAIVPVVGTGR